MAISPLSLIKTGPHLEPPNILLHGVAGVGKTTFASQSDKPVIVCTENGLGVLDVPHFPLARSFDEVIAALKALHEEEHDYRTVVIDSIDWLEPLIWARTCAENDWETIEAAGYGKGYPERDPKEILAALIEMHGNRGKWFAAAKDAGCFDIALQCAADLNVEPATLVRAARDFRDRDPTFAANVALQAIQHYLSGRGYEPSPRDAEAAMSHLHHSAQNAGKLGWAHQMLERLLADKTGKDVLMHDLFSRMMPRFEDG